jgi:two-component system cell cycle sensor histidine kinase/response regulator CckA
MGDAKLTTVLVVEDEAIIAADIQQILAQLGYEVPRTAATGLAAIRDATELRPQLILMDIKLRGEMDGVEAATAIREVIDVPVVFLTSYSDETTLARAKRAAPSGYLIKPFTDRTLRTAVEVALHKHGLEAKLAAREDWFSMILKAIGDGVIATDADESITLMNPAAEALTGWSFADARGKSLSDVFRVSAADGRSVASPLVPAPRGEATGIVVGALLAQRSGASLEIDHSGAPIIDRNGNPLGSVLVLRDVSERRRLEHKMAMSDRLASLGTMSAGIVHEINNPMTYVAANGAFAAELIAEVLAELAADRGRTSDVRQLTEKWASQLGEAHKALGEASEGAERVQQIIKSVGRFTRLDAPPATRLDLASTIERAAKMVSSQFPPRTEVVRDFRPAPTVVANEGQLTEVFMNLLVNASHALASSDRASPRITVSTHSDGPDRCVAEVSDNGCGIPEAIRGRIFEPFFTTKPVGSGTGLGLHICHSIIAGLGGEFTVTSSPERGTVFRISLPAAAEELSYAVKRE